MQIELVSKGRLYKEGNYQKIEIEYIRDGKTQKKKLVAIGDTKEVVRKLVQDFNEGDLIEVKMVKSDDDKYWNWVDLTPVEAGAGKKTSTQVKSGTWETPEERAKKQVYIVRQSSVANALEFHKNNAKLTIEEVLKTAKTIEDFVFGDFADDIAEEKPASTKKSTAKDADNDFEDDIPF
jgi:hypothetical protein